MNLITKHVIYYQFTLYFNSRILFVQNFTCILVPATCLEQTTSVF